MGYAGEYNSAVRVVALQAIGRRFESFYSHCDRGEKETRKFVKLVKGSVTPRSPLDSSVGGSHSSLITN